ncbi:EXS-domain-containing protein [Dichomitus squalens]|uniref:EXS-domain-containing protein n=1 Tax=Dichomitus squalens TaxID=114155 RepID=A0A4Q9N3S3_9APHY|nr:EXS-domain-containing protein [Dichomitus squalens]
MKSDFLDELFFSAAFPLPFRVLCLAGLGILGWATNLHGLHLCNIDAAGALDLNNYDGYRLTSPLPTDRRKSGLKEVRQSSQTYRPVYRVFVAYSAWSLFCWLLFRYATKGDIARVDEWKFVPAVAALCLLTVLVCPFPIFYKQERDKFLAAIHRCAFPSPHRVYFSDVVFADIITSFAKVLGDLWLSLCMLLPSGSLLSHPAYDSLTRWILPVIMSIPYAIRLRQCLVEYNSPNNESRRPLFNALKYASSFPVIFLSAAQRIVVSDITALKGEAAAREPWHGEHQLFRLWLLAAAINSLYSFWWDVTNDWGLDLLVPKHNAGTARLTDPPRPLLLPRLHSRSALLKHPADDDVPDDIPHAIAHQERRPHPYGLRQTLLFPLAMYPFAIMVDLVLRLTWSAKLSTHLHAYSEGDLIIFWIELAEVVRRWIWVFLRVEWEIVKEARELDATRSSPSAGRLSAGADVDVDARGGGSRIAMDRVDPMHSIREPIFEHDDFEMVPSDVSGHNSEAG